MRGSLFGGAGLVVLAVIAFLAYLGVFIVDPTQQALVLRFGDPIRVVTQPGLNLKVPLIDNVVFVEKRVLDLDSPPLEIIASDQKRLVVDAFGRYKVVDPLLFYQTVGTQAVADQRLSVILTSAVRRVLGDATFTQLVREQREQLMQRITEQVTQEGKRLGVEVVDVKIRRADLPEANRQAIYQRMQTERQREAAEYRANGQQANLRIRAEADRAATVIVAEGNKTSDQIRGDGDAARNRVFAEAYGKDPEFFAFFRAMQAYQQALGPTNTRVVLTPDSEFFRYFSDPLGRNPPGTGTPSPMPGAAQGTPPVSTLLPPSLLLTPPGGGPTPGVGQAAGAGPLGLPAKTDPPVGGAGAPVR